MKARNYIIVAVPNNKTLQAVLVSRLTSGLLLEYVEIEFVCAAEMVAVFGRLKENETMEAVAASQSEMRAESNGIPKNVGFLTCLSEHFTAANQSGPILKKGTTF